AEVGGKAQGADDLSGAQLLGRGPRTVPTHAADTTEDSPNSTTWNGPTHCAAAVQGRPRQAKRSICVLAEDHIVTERVSRSRSVSDPNRSGQERHNRRGLPLADHPDRHGPARLVAWSPLAGSQAQVITVRGTMCSRLPAHLCRRARQGWLSVWCRRHGLLPKPVAWRSRSAGSGIAHGPRAAGKEQPMCDTDDRADVTAAEALPASLEWKGEVLPLEPVDELSVLTVCDNVMDMLLPDEGPAKRLPLGAMVQLAPPLEAPTILGGKAADVPLAQHGFSALVEVRKGG